MRPVPVGASAVLELVVTPEHTVHLEEVGSVHQVYASYTMAEHFEEAGRKLLLGHLKPYEVGDGGTPGAELGG